MQTKKKCFIGIDVSKDWLDVSLLSVVDSLKEPMITDKFGNTLEGMKMIHKWLKRHRVPFDEHTLVVIENTGVYHRLIWEYCCKSGLPLHIGNAAGIKWSLGITRGKND